MANPLLIVESPAKANTLKKFLTRGFRVEASVGHLRDLPSKKLGVDVENDFAPEYEVIKGKSKVLAQLKAAAKDSEAVYLAPDPDREGEAIAWHIQQEIQPVTKGKIYRITFHEITKKAVIRAVEQPGEIDQNKVEAQQARRVLDRLVGYKLSPLLGRRLRNWGLSAGRVQSVALRLVCDREKEIEEFVPVEYWTITAELAGSEPPPFEAALHRIDGKKAEIPTEERSNEILGHLKDAEYRVSKVDRKKRRRRASPPFITSTLQQDASRRLRFTAKKTMAIAQQLYEGLDVGEENPVGLITYMRTDSTRIANEALAETRAFIEKEYGKDCLPDKAQVYASKKGVQDAHEAIRPTSVLRSPSSLEGKVSKDQLGLYRLIWNRFVASQMNPAIYDQTSVDIQTGDYTFRATGSILVFSGFTRVYEEQTEDALKKDDTNRPLPPLDEGQAVVCEKIVPKQHFTQPPPRFSEASLVRTLEEEGIGRPSTYASIISTLSDRDYVRLQQRQMHPTDLGRMISGLLVKNFPDLMNVRFTAEMENRLDSIEEGKETWTAALKDFYTPFEKTLKEAESTINEPEPVGKECPDCGGELVRRPSRYGMFIGCSNYPECRYTESTSKREAAPPVETDQKCDKCGSPMVIKQGRFGAFLSCSRYPECKNAKPIPTGANCPKCGSDIVSRRSKKGRNFYGCANYPECDYVSWSRPFPKSCPECESPNLVVQQRELRCPNKECDHTESLPDNWGWAGLMAASTVNGGEQAPEREPWPNRSPS